MKNAKKAVYLFMLFSLTLLFFYKVVFYGEMFFMGDTWIQNYPQRVYAANYMKTFHAVPYWVPEVADGYPLFAEGQTGMLYPLNALYLFLDGPRAYIVSLILHCFLGGAFMFLLMRHLTRNNAAAFLSSILFMFNGFHVAHLNHTNLTNAVVWIPLVFYFYEKGISSSRNLYFGGLVFGIQCLAFHPQVTFLTVIFLVLYALTKAVVRKSIGCVTGLLILLACGAGVSAIQILPALELFLHSKRADTLLFKEAAFFSLKSEDVLSLFFPRKPPESRFFMADPLWELCGYVGWLIPLFVLFSLSEAKKRMEISVFSAVLFFSIILALGENTPVYEILFRLPLFGLFQSPARGLLFFVFSCSVLSGYGYAAVTKCILFKKSGRIAHRVFLFYPFLVYMDLFAFGSHYNPTTPLKYFLQTPQIASFLAKDTSLFRVASLPGKFINELLMKDRDGRLNPLEFKECLLPNSNLLFGVYSFNGYTPLSLKRLDAVLSLPSKNILDMLNVKYIITESMHGENFQKVLTVSPNLSVFRNTTCLPRAFLVHSYRVVTDDDEVRIILQSPSFYPSREVLLEERPYFTGDFKNQGNIGNARIVRYSHHEILVETMSNLPSFLLMSDTYFPGWKVYVDGKQDKIYRADYVMRAIALKEGNHHVRFVYAPQSVRAGITISLLTVMCLSCLPLVSWFAATRPVRKF